MGKRKFVIISIAVITILAAAFSLTPEPEEKIILQTESEQIVEPEILQTPKYTVTAEETEEQPKPVKKYPKEIECTGESRCISGFVTRIIDGDTIVVGDQSIRFALVNTPEWGDFDYARAANYIENICPVGSEVLVDEDDGQTEGSFGRIIGKIYCNNLNLNEEILEVGYAVILPEFCSVSEFAQESWATKHGC